MMIANAGGCWGNWREFKVASWHAIPWVGLLGVHIYLQADAFAPGVNPLQFIISNGVHWVLGDI